MKKFISTSLFIIITFFFIACSQKKARNFTVGQKIDSLNGVYVYYNGAVDHVSGRNKTEDGYNIGQKYQCVEFVKRYYYQYLHHKMPDSYGHAKDFFSGKIKDGQINTQRNLIQYQNGGGSKPQVNDLLVFSATEYNPYGHVAIVSSVSEYEIEMIQQNPGSNADSRVRFSLSGEEGSWKVDHPHLLGWLRKK